MPPLGGLYGGLTVGNPWAYFIGALVGTAVIAIGANMLVNFNDDEAESTAKESDVMEEIDIKFD